MLWFGDSDRRCRSCMSWLAETGVTPFWRQLKDWRQWKLMIRCNSCERTIGVVVKANMPDDPSLIPRKPDISNQKDLFDGHAGGEGSESLHYLAENAAR